MAKINKVNEQQTELTSIDPAALYALIYDIDYNDKDYLAEYNNIPHESTNWKIINSELESSDNEDGGGHYEIVLEYIPTGKLYATSYSDWDMENTDFNEEDGTIDEDGRYDLSCHLTEVVAQSKTITVYVPLSSLPVELRYKN